MRFWKKVFWLMNYCKMVRNNVVNIKDDVVLASLSR